MSVSDLISTVSDILIKLERGDSASLSALARLVSKPGVFEELLSLSPSNSIVASVTAYCCFHGLGSVPKDKQKAIALFEMVRTDESLWGTHQYAHALYLCMNDSDTDSPNTIRDLPPTRQWNRISRTMYRLAKRNYAPAICRWGIYCYQKVPMLMAKFRPEELEFLAYRSFIKAYHAGSWLACAYLGRCHEEGVGTRVNLEKAYEHYKKASDNNQALGFYNLGRCNLFGIHVQVNLPVAFSHFHRAHQLNCKESNFYLGLLFLGDLVGLNFSQNLEKAAFHWKIAPPVMVEEQLSQILEMKDLLSIDQVSQLTKFQDHLV
ncbi:hypothetical protein RCL1_002441 [Eukaryota sp. TZLM3-RCL]